MKKFKRITALLIATALVLGAMFVFASCDKPGSVTCTSHVDTNEDGVCDNEGCGGAVPLSANADYTVNLISYGGEAFEELVYLYVYKGDETVLSKRLTEPTFTVNLPRDNYTLVVEDPAESFTYDEAVAVFTPTKTRADIVMYNALGNAQPISVECRNHADKDEDGECDKCGADTDSADSEDSYIKAPGLSIGASLVPIYKNERNYFIFTPTESGIYKFTCISDSEFTFGHYGMPMVVLPGNIASDLADGSFTTTVQHGAVSDDGGGTLQIVLGVESDANNVIILIERVGDPPVEMPFTDIHASADAKKYTDLLNNSFVDINIKNDVTVVYNENDGYYHYLHENGPIVFMKITAGGNSYLSDFEFPSFQAICETDRLCCYFYEGETLVRKESYNTLISEYAELSGARGLVPLDKTLADAIKNVGNFNGWWSDNSIFGSNSVNVEDAWLFACAYIDENAWGFDGAPIQLSPKDNADFAVKLNGVDNCYMDVKVEENSKTELIFKDAEGITVVIGGIEYVADSAGEISILLTAKTQIEIISTTATELHLTCVKIANAENPEE